MIKILYIGLRVRSTTVPAELTSPPCKHLRRQAEGPNLWKHRDIKPYPNMCTYGEMVCATKLKRLTSLLNTEPSFIKGYVYGLRVTVICSS